MRERADRLGVGRLRQGPVRACVQVITKALCVFQSCVCNHSPIVAHPSKADPQCQTLPTLYVERPTAGMPPGWNTPTTTSTAGSQGS